MSGMPAAATRIEYEPRTPNEELDIDQATGKPIVITRPEPGEIELMIPVAVLALVIFAVILVVVATLIFPDLFFG